MRTSSPVALGLLLTLALTACDGSQSPEGEAEALWSARTAYVGDSSRVAALVQSVGPAPAGDYQISLQTERRPYSLNIRLDSLDKPFDQTDFTRQSTLLLGLIANLDEVRVTSSGQTRLMTTAAASEALGHDVKDLARSQKELAAYLDANGD